MARKSRYNIENKNAQRKWSAALYIRLSREDGDKEESDSVVNQRGLLTSFAEVEADIEVFDTYVDDGYSGTNFDRPDFTRLMEDIKAQRVNCVVVKDLSRFGRNYIDVGNYIEKIFPFMDVRFISVNDTIDSEKNPQSTNTILVPFKNLMNDEYCRDISQKVRSSLDMKRKNGKFIGAFACYGYLKDPNDRNRLIIDEYAASVIQDIFRWFIGGCGIITIAKRLNELGVPNPSEYKRRQGLNYRHTSSEKNDGLWPDSTVRRVLTNKMLTGTLVQGKNKVKSYKVQVSVAQPEDKWIEIENTHEAIIDHETFAKAQELLHRDTRTPPGGRALHLFSGFLRCADCGKAMNRRKNEHPYGTYVYYVCSTFKKMSQGACTKHCIRHDRLENAVLTTIRHQIQLAVSMDELVSAINARGKGKNDVRRLERALTDKEAELRRIERMKLELYPDWKSGAIGKDEYFALKEQFEGQIKAIERSMEALRGEIEAYGSGVDGSNAFLANFQKRGALTKLTRELLAELVEYIYVHEGGEITIQFKFQDEYKRALEYIDHNGGAIETA